MSQHERLGRYASVALRRSRQLARRAAERPAARSAMAHVDAAVSRVRAFRPRSSDAPAADGEPARAASSLPPPFLELNEALHLGRTLALHDVPRGAKTIVSAGAAGRWYFQWVNDAYGPVERHVGVEAFAPRPVDLPDYAEWVSADVGAPGGVEALESGSADMFISGQNLEHLWPEQNVSFLLEANRVLRRGGLLVVDSPNGDLTAAYGWTHPEHTVELTPAEAEQLLSEAGFTLESMKGVWLCRDHGELLPLEPPRDDAVEVLRRFALAPSRAPDSFIWWAEARKTGPPSAGALERSAHRLFARHWPERTGRMRRLDGDPCTWRDGCPGVRMPAGRAGIAMFGPYMPLRPGTYDLEVEVVAGPPQDASTGAAGRLEVVAGDTVIGRTEVDAAPSNGPVRCRVSLGGSASAVHVRLFSYGICDLSAPLGLKCSKP